jgi:hypothetical protein
LPSNPIGLGMSKKQLINVPKYKDSFDKIEEVKSEVSEDNSKKNQPLDVKDFQIAKN